MTNHDDQPQGWTETWPARLSAGMVIVQGLAIIGLVWFLWSQTDFTESRPSGSLSLYLFDVVFFGILLGFPALLVTFSGIGMLFYRGGAWLLAVLAEGLLLAAALYFYFYLPDSQFERSPYIFAIMATGGFLAFYLNTADVRLAFSSRNGDMPNV